MREHIARINELTKALNKHAAGRPLSNKERRIIKMHQVKRDESVRHCAGTLLRL
mgnify:CR=1 FL=1